MHLLLIIACLSCPRRLLVVEPCLPTSGGMWTKFLQPIFLQLSKFSLTISIYAIIPTGILSVYTCTTIYFDHLCSVHFVYVAYRQRTYRTVHVILQITNHIFLRTDFVHFDYNCSRTNYFIDMMYMITYCMCNTSIQRCSQSGRFAKHTLRLRSVLQIFQIWNIVEYFQTVSIYN